ncbi:hypothetical protein [Vibrio phage phiKT1019]|nr:hypothetical protein [Vibrio phage phiKT1019]
MIFVLPFILLLSFGYLLAPEHYQSLYLIMILAVSAGWCITRLLDSKEGSRFRVRATRKRGVTCFFIYDHNLKTEYQLDVMETYEEESVLERDYNSLFSMTFRSHNRFRDSINLVELLSSLNESERTTVSEHFFNLMLVLTHQKPVISHTCYDDYVISDSAREHLASSLRLAI